MEEERDIEKAKEQTDEASYSAAQGVSVQSSHAQAVFESHDGARRILGKQYMDQGQKSIFRSVRNLPAVYRAMRSLGGGRLPSLRDNLKTLYSAHRLTRGTADIAKGMMVKSGTSEMPSIDAPHLTQITDPQNVDKSLMQTKELSAQLTILRDAQNQQLQQARKMATSAQKVRQEARVQQAVQGGRAFVRAGVTATSGMIDAVRGKPVKTLLKTGLAVSDGMEGVGSTLKATLGHLSDMGEMMTEEQHLAAQNDAVHQTEQSIETTYQQQAVLEQLAASKGR